MENEPGQEKHLRGLRILLVEDNEINQEVAKDLLETAGIEVKVADNGQEAISTLLAHKFDLVLLDVQMPVMDGYQTARFIRSDARFANMPIVAMTASTMKGDYERCIEVGMNDHIPKPIDPVVLFSTLHRVLKLLRHDDETRNHIVDINTHDATADWTTLPILDQQLGLSRMMGNKDLYFRILRRFSAERASAMTQVEAALSTENHQEALRIVHSMTSLAGTIGAVRLQRIALALESAMRSDVPYADLLAQFAESLRMAIEETSRLT